MSARRLGVLIRQLPAESATVRSLNDGVQPWTNLEHRVADLWALWAKQDHPVRAEIQAKARNASKAEKLKKMRAKYQNVLPVAEGSASEGVM